MQAQLLVGRPAGLGGHAGRGRGPRDQQPAGLVDGQLLYLADELERSHRRSMPATDEILDSWSPRPAGRRSGSAGSCATSRPSAARTEERGGVDVRRCSSRRADGRQRDPPPGAPGARVRSRSRWWRRTSRASARCSSTCCSTPPRPSPRARPPRTRSASAPAPTGRACGGRGARHRQRHPRGAAGADLRSRSSPPSPSAWAPASGCPSATASCDRSAARSALESEVGKGTGFRVTLPAHAGAADGASPRRRRRPTRGGILVVDDEPHLHRRQADARREHEVTALTTVREALALSRGGERFDVILCDLMMPEMTGVDFYKGLPGRARAGPAHGVHDRRGLHPAERGVPPAPRSPRSPSPSAWRCSRGRFARSSRPRHATEPRGGRFLSLPPISFHNIPFFQSSFSCHLSPFFSSLILCPFFSVPSPQSFYLSPYGFIIFYPLSLDLLPQSSALSP